MSDLELVTAHYISCQVPCGDEYPNCDCKREQRKAMRLAAAARREGEIAMRERASSLAEHHGEPWLAEQIAALEPS